MNILIIEDELASAKLLSKMLQKIDQTLKPLAMIQNIEDGITWLQCNPEPDLIFADIQLQDGLCFEIFEKVSVASSIIFTTAYDEYAIKAFKLNSIDYLLKPIAPRELEKAITKYQSIKSRFAEQNKENLASIMQSIQPQYKSRFLIRQGQRFIPVAAEEIRYFLIEKQLVYLITDKNEQMYLEETLDELERGLDPQRFMRINRQMIVAVEAITSINSFSNNRLQLELKPDPDRDVVVSREKVGSFKRWLVQ